eukprot:9423472-Alexandrium_andersonii.AAC.1
MGSGLAGTAYSWHEPCCRAAASERPEPASHCLLLRLLFLLLALFCFLLFEPPNVVLRSLG